MKRMITMILLISVVAICALSAFACMPPFWGAEEEMPNDLKNLYRGKNAPSKRNALSLLLKGYERKSF